MGFISCCVPSCNDVTSGRHRFPNPKRNENFKKWLSLLHKMKSKYANMPDDKIYGNVRMCKRHFDKNCYSPGTKKLNYDAYPTLNIPDITENEENSNESAINEPTDITENEGNLNKHSSAQNNNEDNNNNLKRNASEFLNLGNNSDPIYKENLRHIPSRFRRKAFSIKKQVALKKTPKIIRLYENIKIEKVKKIKTGECTVSTNNLSAVEVNCKTNQIKCSKENAKGIIHTRFDDQLFVQIKEICKTKERDEKLCSLVFDKVILPAHLHQKVSEGHLVDFENNQSNEKKPQFPDHTMVFMIHGVVRKWEESIFYYLALSTCPADNIAFTIEKIINTAQQAGLKIVATVCDGAATNLDAIEILRAKSQIKASKMGTTFLSFEINDEIINCIIDPPYLIKLIRNHLFVRDLHFGMHGAHKIACWKHIMQLYQQDLSVGQPIGFKVLAKLTEKHVTENKMKEMKVSHCVETLSSTVGKFMLYMANLQKDSKYGAPVLTEKPEDTANCILFLDQLFDSMNGYVQKPQPGKELRGPFGRIQQEFWKEQAKPILFSMYFEMDGKKFRPPCLDYFVENIDNFIDIEKKLRSYDVEYIFLRNFNKDPLDTFFASIRGVNYIYINSTS